MMDTLGLTQFIEKQSEASQLQYCAAGLSCPSFLYIL